MSEPAPQPEAPPPPGWDGATAGPPPPALGEPVLATSLVPPPVTMGRLLARTLTTWREGFLAFTAVSVLDMAAMLAVGWAVGSPLLEAGGFRASPEMQAFVGTRGYWVWMAAGMLASVFGHGATVAGALQVLSGARPTLAGMLATGLRRLPAMAVASLLLLLSVTGGLVLLVVPGLIFGVALGLGPAAAAAEKVGPLRALGRSRTLTRGRRWALLALFLVVGLVGTGLSLAGTALAAGSPLVATVLRYLVAALISPCYAVAAAVAFHDLRMEKEGAAPARLARVFS